MTVHNKEQNIMQKKPAVVVFCKYPNPGQVKTRLAAQIGTQKAAAIYACLLKHTLQECQKIENQSSLILCAEPNASREDYEKLMHSWAVSLDGFLFQLGPTLTERLSEMFASLLTEHPTVVVIGSDLPTISATLLKQAVETMDRIQRPGSLIGPSSDGGFYLLGLNAWHPDLFSHISWSAEDTGRSLAANLRQTGSEIRFLSQHSDIDTSDDLQYYLLQHNTAQMAQQIQEIVDSTDPPSGLRKEN
jgi:rSAM/selenodomain-associated transferase 1